MRGRLNAGQLPLDLTDQNTKYKMQNTNTNAKYINKIQKQNTKYRDLCEGD